MNKDLDLNFNRRTQELHRLRPLIGLLPPRLQFSTARTSGSILLDLFHCYLCFALPLTSPSSLLPTTRKPRKRSSTPSPPSLSQRSSENPESNSLSSLLMSTAHTISAPRSSAPRSSSATRSPAGVRVQGHPQGVHVLRRKVEGCGKSWRRHQQHGWLG
ncbi:hypothetical protein DVH24_031338 [Malus domestica]|uniref:Uncharacterized protein n=1 Tax=Malus domestica TaxID=3750 RepID=A0A498HHM6_MALDO|nr:hypothetical protein DVH24_031338 [Malus domestica]